MGGSSSGGGWSTLGNIRALEERAKAALQEGRRNVFISFATEDMDEVNLLRAHAKNENSDIEFNDHSVREPYNSERAEYIRMKIAERIARSSVCVVYLSASTVQSEWVAWEVKESLKQGKRILAVHPGNRAPAALPDWCKAPIEIVAWANLGAKLK